MKSQTIRLCAVVLAALVQLGLAQERPPAEGAPKSNARRLAEETFLLEPLVWLGAEPPKEKDASELLGLLVSIQESGRLRRLDDYLEKHPDSGWGASLRAQHATTCREFGRYGVALRHWESAWKSTRHYTSGEGKKVADYVLAHWSQLLASLGRRETLEALFAENKHRNLGYYQSTYDRSLTAAGMMRDHPSLAFRCGTLALYHVAGALKVDNNEVGKLTALSSPTNGFSITMLLEFAGKARLKMVAVERKPGDPIAVPSVVHWRENHYAAILSTADDCYEVVDPTFGRTQWLHKSVIDEEASGKFLVPEKLAPGQWRRLTKAEMDGTRGMGIYCDIFDFTDEGKNSFQQDCSGLDGSLAGMPRWWVTEPYLNLWMADEPVFYNTSSGPMGFRLYYRQRDNDSTFPLKLKPGVFAPRSGMSDARWSHQWNTCVFFRDNTYDANFALSSGTVTNIPSYSVVDAMLLLPQGGARSANFVYNSLTQRTEQKEERSKESFKVRSGTTLALGGALLTNGLAWQTNGTAGFAMVYPDGSQDVYGYAVRESSGNNIFAFSSKSSGKAYLTSKIDARGNVTLFGYQSVASTSTALAWRLKHVVDCDRRTNTFTHHPTYPDQITEVATPFGQRATIKYDNYQRITNIVDAAGLASSITYAGTNGYVKQLITPYGTNGFEIHDYSSALGADGSRSIGGHYVARAIQVTEPNGGKQLFLYRYETPTNWTHIPDTYPSSQVPVGWFVGNVPRLTAPAAPVELRTTLDNGTQLNGSPTASLKYRNSFYWSRKQSGSLSVTDLGTGLANINNLNENDYKLAWWRHWLEQSVARTNSSAVGIPVVSDRIGIERLPSADGTNVGAVTWYGYFKPSGTANHQSSSTEALPNVIARILADGTTQFSVLHYNPLGAVTNHYSTYTDITNNTRALRLWNFQYAANHIDLIKVTGPQGVIATLGYNSGHQLEAITNGVGDVTRIGYMGGLLRRIDYPTKFRRTFDYGYSTLSVESSTTGPVRPATTLDDNFVKQIVDGVSGATVSLTYTNGALRTITDPRGLRATNTWDGLFRLTGVTFSNQTVISNQFSRLDYVGFRDQATNWTRAGYNAMGQVTMLTNANGAVTGFGYCTCGALTLVTNFHSLGPPYVIGVTTNNYDRQLRLTSVNHPDGSTWTYKYDQWGWLTNLSDGAGRTFTFGYNHQGLMTSVSNAFGLVRQIQYDAMDRPVYVINGNLTGGRDYTALKYDLIGRPTNVVVASVNGSPSGSYGYTYASNRLASVTDPYGKITRYNYDGAGRLIILTNANNEVLRFSYNPAGDLLTLTDARNQVTTWKYDEFGRLTNKLDSANRKVYDLAYTVNGWLAAKTVADVSLTTAKTTNVGVGTITYGYDKVGNLLQKQVPNVGTYLYYYDALNRLEEMWDPGTGTQSGIVPAIARPKPYGTTFSYTPAGQLTKEDGPWTADALTATYAQGLRTGLGIEAPSGSAWSQGYTYDSARRLKTVTNSAGTFTYDYWLSLNEPNRISFPGGMIITNTFELSGKVRETTLKNSSGTMLGYHGYQFDLAGRTTNHVRLTSSKWAYQYDAIGQLTNAIGREANNTVRLHEKLGYRYDAAGNLIYRTNNALVQSLVVTNNGNELNKISRSGTYTVSGVVVGATNVTVNGLTASLYLDGGFARDGLSLVNGQNTFTVIAKGGGVSATNQVTVNLPDPVAFTHDARGNLLNDGQPLLAYDAEDQLTSIRVPPTATAAGWETQFVYDGLGRLRIRREITVPATGSTTTRTTNQVRYLYDGFTAVQERDGNNAVLATYTRGNDLSGSPQGAGGIGGLLARTEAGGSVFYHADAGGNVTTLFNAAQAVVGRYAYDPFGNLLGMSGAGAAGNRYRFSSKEMHPQTGMYYYGFRFYEPNLQRWTSRDPISELGGLNLYGFVANNPLGYIDPFGLAWYDWADDLAGWAQGENQLFSDSMLQTAGVGNSWAVAGLLNSVSELTSGMLSFPQALGQLGSGSGNFAGQPTFANSAGVFGDISMAANVMAMGMAPLPGANTALRMPCPAAAPKQILPGMNLDGKIGKLTQHAPDWGIGTKGNVPAGAADQVAQIAKAIHKRATTVKQGAWRGGVDDALFYSNGKHVVVTKNDGTFVTILKNAQNNKWFNQAKTIWKQ